MYVCYLIRKPRQEMLQLLETRADNYFRRVGVDHNALERQRSRDFTLTQNIAKQQEEIRMIEGKMNHLAKMLPQCGAKERTCKLLIYNNSATIKPKQEPPSPTERPTKKARTSDDV